MKTRDQPMLFPRRVGVFYMKKLWAAKLYNICGRKEEYENGALME